METDKTENGFTIAIFRLLSIYSFVKAVELFSQNFGYLFEKETLGTTRLIQIVGPSVLLIVCGFVIWRLSPVIALRTAIPGLMLKDEALPHVLFNATIPSIGLFVIVISIPEIVYAVGFHYILVFHSAHPEADPRLVYATAGVQLFSLIVKLGLGMLLLFCSNRVLRIIRA